MRSASRLITILCFGLLFTCGVEAQQPSKPRRPAQVPSSLHLRRRGLNILQSDPATARAFLRRRARWSHALPLGTARNGWRFRARLRRNQS